MNKKYFIFGFVFLLFISLVSATIPSNIDKSRLWLVDDFDTLNTSLWDSTSQVTVANSLLKLNATSGNAFIQDSNAASTYDRTSLRTYEIKIDKIPTNSTKIIGLFSYVDATHLVAPRIDDQGNLLYVNSVGSPQTACSSCFSNGDILTIVIDGSSRYSLFINNDLKTNTTDFYNFDYSGADRYFVGVAIAYGEIDYVLGWNGSIEDKPLLENFELTLNNAYNSSPILNFTAQITNSTISQNITTTNGSIFWNNNDLINISIFNIENNTFFNESFFNYNTSVNLLANAKQTNITFNILFNQTNVNINTTNITIEDLTNGFSLSTNTGILNFDPLSNTEITFRFSGDGLIIYNRTFTFSTLEINEYDIEINETLNNLTFIENKTGNAIIGADITIDYPSGESITFITDSSGSIYPRYISENYLEFGDWSITINALPGYITPVSFERTINLENIPYNESIQVYTPTININIYDRETGNFLNSTTNIIILGLLNVTIENETYIIQNSSIVSGPYTIQAISEGYATEQLIFDYIDQENLTISLYLLNLTGDNTGTIYANVIDEFYRIIQDAKVELMEYDETAKAFIKVSECYSNSNGECAFFIELNVKTYYLKASKTISDELYFTETSPEIIRTDEETRQLFLRLSSQFNQINIDNVLINIEEEFENNISTIYISYITTDGTDAEICVEYFKDFGNYKISVYNQCVNSSSAYIATPVLLDRNYNYIAEVYINNPRAILQSFYYDSEISLINQLKLNNYGKYLVLFLWAILLAFSLYSKNISLFCFAGIILSWFEYFFLTDFVMVEASVFKTIILLMIFFVSRKKEEGL